jgi:hypothetical protein
MLEIIALVFLTRALANQAQLRGRSTGWAALGPVLWILMEAAVFVFVSPADFSMFERFAMALAAGALGGGVAYLVVTSLSSSEWMADAEA